MNGEAVAHPGLGSGSCLAAWQRGSRRAMFRMLNLASKAGLLVAALLLLFTGVVKAGDAAAFERTLELHGLLSTWWSGQVAWVLPVVEMGLGAGAIGSLAFGTKRGSACVALAALFLVFMLYAGALVLTPPAEPAGCGCGLRAGPIMDWTPIVVQNGVSAAALGVAGVVLSCSRWTRVRQHKLRCPTRSFLTGGSGAIGD